MVGTAIRSLPPQGTEISGSWSCSLSGAQAGAGQEGEGQPVGLAHLTAGSASFLPQTRSHSGNRGQKKQVSEGSGPLESGQRQAWEPGPRGQAREGWCPQSLLSNSRMGTGVGGTDGGLPQKTHPNLHILYRN